MQGRTSWLVCVSLVIFASLPAQGDDPAPPAATTRPHPSVEELRSWVAQLNDDDYAVREQAARKLTEAGPAAIEALVEGLASDQAEVAWRCGAALEQIGVEGNEKTIDRIVTHLDAACAKTGRQGLKSLAGELQARQKQFRRERAVAQIRKHGGQIVGTGIDGRLVDFAAAPMVGPVMVFDGAVAVEEVIEPVDPPKPAVFDALDLFLPGVGRAIAKALVPGAAEPAVDEKVKAAEEAAEEVKRATEEAVKELEQAAKAAQAATDEAKAARAAADDKPAKARPAEEKPADAAPAPAVEVIDVGPAIAVAEVPLGAMMALDVGGDIGAANDWAQLTLDQNWRGGDEGLSALADVPELSQINLQRAPLTDKALDHLARLPRLGMVNIYAGNFTRDGLLGFHTKHPGVTVYCHGDAMMGVNADFGASPLALTTVMSGSGASDAGLRPGDVIGTIDGVKIRDFSDLTICVSTRKPGDKLQVQYERGGKEQTVEVTLKRRTGAE